MDSDLKLESRLGQVWSKLIANPKDSDHILEAVGSHGKALAKGSGRKASKKTNVATMCLAGRGGSVRSAGVKWVLNQQ